MNGIKIMHCADLHLGAELSSLGRQAGERRGELLSALGNITAECKKRGTELLLIAGDLFDTQTVSDELFETVKSYFASIPDTAVAVVSGNHDFLCANSPYYKEWSENVHIFKNAETVEIKGVKVTGIPFTSAYSDGFSLPRATDGINILLMHADTDGGPYNPVTPQALFATGMDYIALGHVHKTSGLQKSGNVTFAYSGCPEPMGFDELGKKGVLCGTVYKNRAELEFLPLALREYKEILLNAADTDGNSALLQLAEKTLCGEENNFIKLCITGECDFSPDIHYLSAELSKKAYYLKVRDNTYPRENLELLKNEQTLKGIFVRKMLKRIETGQSDEREILSAALRLGLNALGGREVETYDN